jgi:hypothetical protein
MVLSITGADLFERIAEHVHKDHARTLRHRQAHERAQRGGCDCAALLDADRVDDRVQILVGASRILARPPAQKIERRVVRNAEQPSFDIIDWFAVRKCFDGLHARLLQDVFAVDGRAGHARAITMQFRPQLPDNAIECCARLRRIGRGRAHISRGSL